jgi:hypothetical protein
MHVEVWSKPRFGRPIQIGSDLYLVLREGEVSVQWEDGPVQRSTLPIEVSEELVVQVLEAFRGPCPFVGKRPVEGQNRPGYVFWGDNGPHDLVSHEYCEVCGYFTTYDDSPRLRSGPYGSHGIDGHPVIECLQAPRPWGSFERADWDTERSELILAGTAGRLAIWIGNPKQRAALINEVLPTFRKVLECDQCVVLLLDGQDS